MSEATADPMPLSAMTAGRLLREARQAQGLHIAALASAIKVAPRKLELLEADRFDELPDATFTRALAQTVCRSLKVDAAPVLALLPRPSGNRLGQVSEGLNTPFRERPGRLVPSDWTSLGRPGVWGPALVLLTAAAVYFMPSGLFQNSATRVRPPVDSAASAAALATPVVRAGSAAEPTAVAASSVPAVVLEAALPLPAPPPLAAPADAPPKLLQLHAVAGSWIEVVDGRGRALLSRLINPGENVELDGAVPLKVKIGNAAGTEVIFRGQVLELAPFTRDNMARLELK
ncbi:MAG TPA: helix-turn-helix domain-containing protein [Caldimonas sp.]